MRILCLDTATDVGTVAVLDGAVVLAERSTPLDARLGDTLLGTVEAALADAGVRKAALEACAVGVGPGSFTGLRVGIAMAKGLHLALGVPLVGVSTPRTLARATAAQTSVVCIDARKDEAFIACFRRSEDGALEALLDGVHGPHGALGARVRAVLGHAVAPLVCGTGATETLLAGLGAPFTRSAAPLDRPSARWMLDDARARLATHGPDDPRALVPDYVRGADVTLPAAARAASSER